MTADQRVWSISDRADMCCVSTRSAVTLTHCLQPDAGTLQTEDRQRLRLQKLLCESSEAGDGGAAATLDVDLSCDLCNSCKCGEVVSVTGYVRVAPGDAAKYGAALSLLYIDAVSLVNASSALGLDGQTRPLTQVRLLWCSTWQSYHLGTRDLIT